MITLPEKPRTFFSQHIVAINLFIAIIVLFLDFLSVRRIQFPILFILPVGLVAWHGYARTAFSLACILPLGRFIFNFIWYEPQPFQTATLNLIVRISALLLYAYLIDRTSRQTTELKKELRVLKGIVPVCAWCKKIRNQEGLYEDMETYIASHTEASFSHGMCPECARKYYPDIPDK